MIQFHVLPSFVAFLQFQTVSNPLPTEVGEADGGKFQLNVSMSGNRVSLSTGVVNTTVSNTIYSDGQIAIYQVEGVLLPLAMFGVAPAPAPEGKTKSSDTSTATTESSDDDGDRSDVPSDAFSAMNYHVGGLPVYSFVMGVVVFSLNF